MIRKSLAQFFTKNICNTNPIKCHQECIKCKYQGVEIDPYDLQTMISRNITNIEHEKSSFEEDRIFFLNYGIFTSAVQSLYLCYDPNAFPVLFFASGFSFYVSHSSGEKARRLCSELEYNLKIEKFVKNSNK